MVVDDSVVIRGLISRWIASEPDMVVAASLRTGLDAVNQIERVNPDVAVLDIEMPELDGISALPLLLAKKRNLIIIMASTLTRRNAEISFKALSLGASDYIPKPESTRDPAAAETFRHDLIQKIRHLGAKVRRTASRPLPPLGADAGSAARADVPTAAGSGRRPSAAAARVQRASAARASDRFIDRRSAGADVAGHRARSCDRPLSGADHAAYAADIHDDSCGASDALEPAAGARSRSTAKSSRPAGSISRRAAAICASRAIGTDVVIALDDGPPVNFCKPAVDPAVYLRDRYLAGRRSGRGADGHGLGRHARRQGDRRGRRQRDRPGRSFERGVGNAGRGRECRHLRGRSAARPDRAETGSIVFGRSFVTPLDYEFLRKLLKERSGLDLSSDKQYLVESRLIPLARRAGLPGIAELVAED